MHHVLQRIAVVALATMSALTLITAAPTGAPVTASAEWSYDLAEVPAAQYSTLTHTNTTSKTERVQVYLESLAADSDDSYTLQLRW